MEFQYLGTAAAEAIPALFCGCDACVRSRRAGGRAVRTRSQAIIDGTLLIDFPADTYGHFLTHNINTLNITACLITHTHSDHLYPKDMENLTPTTSKVPDGFHITFCGSDAVRRAMEEPLALLAPYGRASFVEMKEFETRAIGKYAVTALPAVHAPHTGPVLYMISDGVKTVLYAHDTHEIRDDVWSYLEENRIHLDLVSLDCTHACQPRDCGGHMNLTQNAQVRRQMLEAGIADEHTVFVSNHFSHNGIHVVYDDFVPLAEKEGLLTSYDGMKIIL